MAPTTQPPREDTLGSATAQYATLDGTSYGTSFGTNYSPTESFDALGMPRDTSGYRMSKADLFELRDHLVKNSMVEPGPGGYESLTTSAHKLQPLRGTVSRQSHFVNVISYPQQSKSGAFDPAASAFEAKAAAYDMDAPHTAMLPRESVAVLIDAVRSSVLPDDEKSRFLFELFDVDRNGVLSRDSVAEFIEATLVAGKLQTVGEGLDTDAIVARIFAGTKDPQHMTFREFQRAFSGVIQEEAQQKKTTEAPRASKPKASKGFFGRLKKRYKTYTSEAHWLILYFVAMIAAFWIKAYYVTWDPAVGYSAKIAKGFAQIVMVNTLCLLLPMCRKFVAFLRKFAEVSSRVPVDQNIEFHKICGIVMLIASLGHTVAWVFIAYYLRTVPYHIWETSRFAHLTFVREESILELCERTPMWTGVLMVVIGLVAAPLTHPKIRRGNFNAFWLTHLMFVPFLVLILIHGLAMWVQPPQAWYWVLPPIVLYIVERRYRVASARGGNTKILRVRFSKEAVAIFMEKPRGFHYHPGMYLFLKMPLISTYEWHPFTISSAPEDDYVSVHVRNAGDWTGALHAVLRQCLNRAEKDIEGDALNPEFPVIFIDGPVGAPSQDYYRYESVVFVGAGIGVTPFASILQSIMHQWEAFRCDRCNNVKLPKTFKLKKIYFYWITREQEALTWFTETMNQLSAMDKEGRLEIHNYYSPLKEKSVIEPLHALQRFIHDAEGRDIISGLSTKQLTHFGRPDWHKELRRIAAQQDVGGGSDAATKCREVGVFFCGPKPMGNAILGDIVAFNQDNARPSHNVTFNFHSENF